MNEILIVILELVWTFLIALVMFVLGKKSERKSQSLIIRAQLLNPISDWLGGVDKFIGILGDTLSSVIIGSATPITYDLEERRKSAQFMIENTNEVIGIVESQSLITEDTEKYAAKLAEIIRELDAFVKFKLLSLDHEILDRSAKGILNEAFVKEVGDTKLCYEAKVQMAYSLIAKIKTSLA